MYRYCSACGCGHGREKLIQEKKAEVTVLQSKDRWYGVTYKEDKPTVVKAIQALKNQGLYPQNLWN